MTVVVEQLDVEKPPEPAPPAPVARPRENVLRELRVRAERDARLRAD